MAAAAHCEAKENHGGYVGRIDGSNFVYYAIIYNARQYAGPRQNQTKLFH